MVFMVLTAMIQLNIISTRNPSFWWNFSKKSAPRPSLLLLTPVVTLLIAATFVAVYWPASLKPDGGRGEMAGAGTSNPPTPKLMTATVDCLGCPHLLHRLQQWLTDYQAILCVVQKCVNSVWQLLVSQLKVTRFHHIQGNQEAIGADALDSMWSAETSSILLV